MREMYITIIFDKFDPRFLCDSTKKKKRFFKSRGFRGAEGMLSSLKKMEKTHILHEILISIPPNTENMSNEKICIFLPVSLIVKVGLEAA